MSLQGVSEVYPVRSRKGGEQIWVKVDLEFPDPNGSKIPASADGISVVILPASTGDFGVTFYEGYPANATPTEREKIDKRNQKQDSEDVSASEEAYLRVVRRYGQRWLAQPGVVGIRPVECADNGCDFGSVGIVVQGQFLDQVRKHIPSAVTSVPIVLIPQDQG